MIVCGVDPGTSCVGLARLDAAGQLTDFGTVHGTLRPRPTKNNPEPVPINRFVECRRMARATVAWFTGGERLGITEDVRVVFAVEGAAFSRVGADDALAAYRQALFDELAERIGDSRAAMMLVTIPPTVAKKAIAGYTNADKRRVVEAAVGRIPPGELFVRWEGMRSRKATTPSREQEAVADALAIALAARERAA